MKNEIQQQTTEKYKTHSATDGTEFPDSEAKKSHTKIASPKLTRDLESGIKITSLIDSVWPINTFNPAKNFISHIPLPQVCEHKGIKNSSKDFHQQLINQNATTSS